MLRALLVAFSVTAAAAAAADIPLPVADAGPAAAERAATAAAGGKFLVAWTDERGVCAARRDADGTLLDPVPLVIDPGPPHADRLILLGGDGWVLFWADLTSIRAARVDLDGRLVDAPPKRFTASTAFDVVRDGNGFALIGSDGGLRLIDADLTTIRQIGQASTDGYQPALAASGHGYLAAIRDRLAFFDEDGRVLAKTTLPGGVNTCRVGSVGGAYLVAWTTSPSATELAVATFDAEGRAIVPPRTISALPASRFLSFITFALTSNGAGYTVMSIESGDDGFRFVQRVRGHRFAPNGSPIETFVTDNFSPPGWYNVLGLAWNGTDYFLLTTTGPRFYLQGRVFRSFAAFPSAPEIPSLVFAPHKVTAAAIAARNDDFVAAWLEDLPDPAGGTRPSAAVHFTVVGGTAVELDRGSIFFNLLDVASNGASSLVVWADLGGLRIRLLRRDGTWRDVTVPVTSVVESLRAGWSGRAYVVLWTDLNGAAYSVAISPGGEAGAIRTLATAWPFSIFFTAMACAEPGCMASGVAQDGYPVGSRTSQVLVTVRFDPDGNAVAPAQRKYFLAYQVSSCPFFDRNGNAFVLYYAAQLNGDSMVIAAVKNDGTIDGDGTMVLFDGDLPLLATDFGFYSHRVGDVWHSQLVWSSVTLTPRPAITERFELGTTGKVLGIAVGEKAAAVLLHISSSALVVREIPAPTPRRRRAS